jgi:hypothetical protein
MRTGRRGMRKEYPLDHFPHQVLSADLHKCPVPTSAQEVSVGELRDGPNSIGADGDQRSVDGEVVAVDDKVGAGGANEQKLQVVGGDHAGELPHQAPRGECIGL